VKLPVAVDDQVLVGGYFVHRIHEVITVAIPDDNDVNVTGLFARVSQMVLVDAVRYRIGRSA
jgi:hypothetical protein